MASTMNVAGKPCMFHIQWLVPFMVQCSMASTTPCCSVQWLVSWMLHGPMT